MQGTIRVETGELFHLSHLFNVAYEALNKNDAAQLSSSALGSTKVADALSDFNSNWNYKRKDLADRLHALAEMLSKAAIAYEENESSFLKAFAQAVVVAAEGAIAKSGSGTGQVPSTNFTDPSQPQGTNIDWGKFEKDVFGPAPGTVGATSGVLQPPSGGVDGYRAAAGFVYDPTAGMRGNDITTAYTYGPPANGYRDQWLKAANNCTSWVAYRRSQLGLSVPAGNGGKMGTDPNLPPTLGAVVSWGTGIGPDWGHVMVVEEVISPTEFRVSEMNHDGNGGFQESRVWTKNPDGTWSSPGKKNVTLKFTP